MEFWKRIKQIFGMDKPSDTQSFPVSMPSVIETRPLEPLPEAKVEMIRVAGKEYTRQEIEDGYAAQKAETARLIAAQMAAEEAVKTRPIPAATEQTEPTHAPQGMFQRALADAMKKDPALKMEVEDFLMRAKFPDMMRNEQADLQVCGAVERVLNTHSRKILGKHHTDVFVDISPKGGAWQAKEGEVKFDLASMQDVNIYALEASPTMRKPTGRQHS